jgi:FkbM family methyltransferase
MRRELFYNPRLLCERLAVESINRRRQARLRRTVAEKLHLHDVSSLELLELMQSAGIKVIYDIGAHVGTWSLLAKAIFPSAQIHGFEPLPQHREEFLSHFVGMKDVTLHSVGLGASNGTTVFHITNHIGSSSVLPLGEAADCFALKEVGRSSVELHRLDDYRAAHRLKLPDMIKLDVQGYELQALQGAEQCLRAARAVLMEVSFVEIYQGQPLFEDVVRYMADAGFRLHALSVATGLGQALVQTDVLFLATADSSRARDATVDERLRAAD